MKAQTTHTKTVDGYVRVSRKMGRHGEGYLSPKIQREAIERWAAYRGIEIAAWHFDEDQSGKTQNRPGLRAALERIENGETGGIACWRVDRFARNVGPAEADVETIKRAGAMIAFVSENLDTDGPMGEMLFTILLSMARYQLAMIEATWHDVRRRARDRGVFIGPTPLGYRKITDKNDPLVGTLVPDPATAPIVQEAFQRAASDGVLAAQQYLIEQLPDRYWQRDGVRKLLRSRVYLGETRNGDEFVKPDAHEALVSLAVWTAAYAAQSPTHTYRRRVEYPLSGIARCESCGGPLVGHNQKNMRARADNDQASSYRRYRCQNAECVAKASISADALEALMRDTIENTLAEWTLDVSIAPGRLAICERELERAEQARMKLSLDTRARELMGDAAWYASLEAHAQAVGSAESDYLVERSKVSAASNMPAVDQLDDPVEYQRALQIAIDRIDVRKSASRGESIDDRVVIVPRSVERHDAPVMLAA